VRDGRNVAHQCVGGDALKVETNAVGKQCGVESARLNVLPGARQVNHEKRGRDLDKDRRYRCVELQLCWPVCCEIVVA